MQPDAIRLAPPLILSSAQAAAFTAALPSILDAADAGPASPAPAIARPVTDPRGQEA